GFCFTKALKISSWQSWQVSEPAYGGLISSAVLAARGAATPRTATPSSFHRFISAPPLIFRMNFVDSKVTPGSVAHSAALPNLAGVHQRMRRSWDIDVTSGAGRRNGLNWINRPLRIGHLILSGRQASFASADVAQRAIAGITSSSRGAHRRIADIAEIVV